MPAGEVTRPDDGEAIPLEVVLLVPQVTADLEHAHADLAFTLLQMPLNYYGLRLVEHSIEVGEPDDVDPQRVRAIGTWFNLNDELPEWVWPWLQRQSPSLRVLHLGSLRPLARDDNGERLRSHLRRFGMGYDTRVVTDPSRVRVSYPHPREDRYPFESKPVYERAHLGPWNLSADNTVWVATKDRRNPRTTRAPVVTGPFGGIGLQPWLLRVGGDDLDRRWYVDPFAFCYDALGLSGWPAADPAVQNGRRRFILHVDGDGFESESTVASQQNCGQVFRDRIVDAWPMPMTISFVVASLTDALEPAEPTDRMRVAREIGERDWVELASHSVLHPLNWRRRLHPRALPRSVVWYPELSGFEHSMVAEVRDSIAFINRWLAPPPKRCQVMLWSGAANPTSAALQAAADAGCENFNGGLFRCDALHDSIGFVSPWGRRVGDSWQVFAGASNENEFPGFFTTMPAAFGHVTTTIERTGSPRILKPANVYCHFYSAEHPARLRALEQLLERWVKQAETVPVYASTYARAVRDAQFRVSFARTSTGIRFDGCSDCRTIRFEREARSIDWRNSRGLLGARRMGNRLFVHVSEPTGIITFARTPQQWLHVEQANCELTAATVSETELKFTATGFGVRRVVVAGAAAGATLMVEVDGEQQPASSDIDGRYELVLRQAGSSEVRVWLP